MAKPKKERGLTAQQEDFAQWVVKLGKQCAAYRKAYKSGGMSRAAIDVEACRLMANPKIALRVSELRARALVQFDMEVEEIALGLARIARADLREAFDPETGALLAPQDMPEDLAMALTSIEVVEMQGGMAIHVGKGKKGEDGEEVAVGGVQHVPMYTKKLRIADRKGALDTLAKWRGMLVERAEQGKPGEFADLKAKSEAELAAEARQLLAEGVKAGVIKVLPTKGKQQKAA